MHPAYSVILFTTASGAGYGLLFWLGVGALFGGLPDARWFPLAALTVALALITAGLVSSSLHLGHPERAHRAFSQWRTSWLSREGVVAVATYLPAGLLWLAWAFHVTPQAVPWLGALSALGAVATVYCTGMIYAALRTIPEWNRSIVPIIYIVLAAATGALLLALMFSVFGGRVPTWLLSIAFLGVVAAGILKRQYWQSIDSAPAPYTVEQATGLGSIGKVRVLDPPHTRPNFVMREMGFAVARKHALKLRKAVLLALVAVPAVLILAALFLPWSLLWTGVAVCAAAVGVFVERWLFFAEARHVSMLYYQHS